MALILVNILFIQVKRPKKPLRPLQNQKKLKKKEARAKDRVIDAKVAEEFAQQRLLACISSRPGQSGRADGYILEGK
jgi:ribosomal protein S8E